MKKATIIYIISALFLIGCGYTTTEDDKYPEIPVFPYHSNSNISLKPTGMLIDTIFNGSNGELLGVVEVYKKEANYYKRKVLASFTKDLKIKDSIPILGGDYAFGENGDFYIENENDEIVKYSSFKSKGSIIKKHPFNGVIYKKQLEKELESKGVLAISKYPDSLHYDIYRKIDTVSYQKSNEEFEKRVLKDLKYVIVTNNSYILTYSKNQYILNKTPSLGYKDTSYSKIANFKKSKLPSKYITDYKKDIIMIDKAVLANGSAGGNHFSFGYFYTIGYEYYELNIDGIKTKFKTYGKYVGRHHVTSRKLPSKNIYLIDTNSKEGNPVTYIAKKNNT